MSIRSVLFAAGLGTRLLPYTAVLPKACLPILDVPLGAFGLSALSAVSSPVLVNVSHLADVVETELGRWGDPLFFKEAPEPYGTAGTLVALRPRLSETFVTWNSDLLADVDLPELLATHHSSSALATLAVTAVTEAADLHVSDGRVTRFINRRAEPQASEHRFIGVAVYERSALDMIPPGLPRGLGETVFPRLVAERQLAVHVNKGYATDVGTPGRYLGASLDALYGRAPAAPGGAWPGRVVEVPEGRAYVGPGANMAEGSLGDGAIVLAHASVARGAKVERSIVWPGTLVPSGTHLLNQIHPPNY